MSKTPNAVAPTVDNETRIRRLRATARFHDRVVAAYEKRGLTDEYAGTVTYHKRAAAKLRAAADKG